MASGKKKRPTSVPKLVRKSILVDPVQLEKARKALGVTNNAELVRLALDQILRQLHRGSDEEE